MADLSGGLQENLLVLLSFDPERSIIIRNVIEPELFGGLYQHIVVAVYDYIDRYKAPPKDHLPDILADKLTSKNRREQTLFRDIVESIYEMRNRVNAEFVMTQVSDFVKRQSLRSVAAEIGRELVRDTPESLLKAENLFRTANVGALRVFDSGLRLSDKKRALKFLERNNDCFATGIPELDRRGLGPTRKELFLYIANTKSGKTWALIQLAKASLVQRLRVAHITLENSEEITSQRYFQSLFSMSKRRERFKVTRFKRDKLGRIVEFEDWDLLPKFSMDDPNIKEKLERKIDQFAGRLLDNIVIKYFPTGTLTMGQLNAYLDNLFAVERFAPDLIIVDYPDLMELGNGEVRFSLDIIYKNLRGVAGARNAAMAVVSQSNRAGAKAKQIGLEHQGEAYSKAQHADTVVTYTSTIQEDRMGLARLHVAGARNDSDKFSVVISQNYGSGQFVVDSALMTGNYWGNVSRDAGEDVEDEETPE